MKSILCHEHVIKLAKAKVHVYSPSALCQGEMHDHSEANEKWKSQLKDFQQTNEYTELFGVDGEPSEFEWRSGSPTKNPEQFGGIMIFMSLLT